ncbi:ankyrin repeat domain-containing protein [Sorangium sp. So ce321]|uniref:ankyrin repeat domain-containing protein n=1 Tax=Sorangium sp. So ce321 TaxID=3133300 RepID=UPI003F5D574D
MDEPLIEAVKHGDAAAVQALIDSGVNVNIHGNEQKWTPLSYAAGSGNLAIVKLLVEAGGADVTLTGCDNRTPYDIAVAAGRRAVARYLADAEALASGRPRAPKPYCRAYHLRALREFPGWTENGPPGEDDTVVFVHQDLTVTRSMFHGEDVVMSDVSPQWQAFCRDILSFEVPDDFDLMPIEH